GASTSRSFDHLGGEREQRLRNLQPESLGSGEGNAEMEPGRVRDWDIARLRPAQNLVGELGGATIQVGQAWSIGHQASRFREFSKPAHHRQPRSERQRADEYSVRVHKRVANDVQRVRSALEQLERRIDVRSLAYL